MKGDSNFPSVNSACFPGKDYSIAPRIPPARFCEESCRWVVESRARGSEEQIIAIKLRTTTKTKRQRQRQQGQYKRREGRRKTATTTTAATPKGPREHPEGDFASPGRSLWLPRGCFRGPFGSHWVPKRAPRGTPGDAWGAEGVVWEPDGAPKWVPSKSVRPSGSYFGAPGVELGGHFGVVLVYF